VCSIFEVGGFPLYQISLRQFASAISSAQDPGWRRVARLRISASRCASIPATGEFVPLCFTQSFHHFVVLLNIALTLI
jgi:hypothetical protein